MLIVMMMGGVNDNDIDCDDAKEENTGNHDDSSDGDVV